MSEEIVNGNGRKLGRNQKLAVIGYAVPLGLTFIGCVAAGVKMDDVVPVLDRWIGFAQIYVPVAMGTVLVVSGAIKSIQAIATNGKKKPA